MKTAFIFYSMTFIILGILANWFVIAKYLFFGVFIIGVIFTLFQTGNAIINTIKDWFGK